MTTYASYETPFNIDSLWYARPKQPVLSDIGVPSCYYPRNVHATPNLQYADVNTSVYSTGIYRARPTDPPVTIYPGPNGLLDADTRGYVSSRVVPHWPAEAEGAVGSDGHCDIIDEQGKRVYSFWQLRKDANGRYTAAQFAWAPLDGSGWGEGAQYCIGARAAGVPTCAGMIRKHELVSSAPDLGHVLSCSLDYSALENDPSYILPATMGDYNPQGNYGSIPEGSLLMLPPNFNINAFNPWPQMRKVIATLMRYGARVVDRNENTPIVFYAEKGSGWSSMPNGWDSQLASQLEGMRAALRMVSDAGGFVTPDGRDWAPAKRTNLMSARGPWRLEGQSANIELFDSLNQRLQLPATNGKWINGEGKGFMVPELRPVEGRYYKLWVDSDCGALLNLILNYWPVGASAAKRAETGFQSKWKEVFIKWPRGAWHELQATKTPGAAGYLAWRFIEVPEAEYLAGARKMPF